MEIRLIKNPIALAEVASMAEAQFGEMIKAAVDVELKIMALGGDLHADEETLLLDQGSSQEHLWGINIYPGKPHEEWIEFDSMINIRPAQNNRSRGVEDKKIQEQILQVVRSLIAR